MSSRQKEIDFTRSEQLAILRDCVMPKGRGVAPPTLKLLLKAIDDYGRGSEAWVSIDTLATNVCVNEKTIRRAAIILEEQMSVLIVERRKNPYGTTTNHYRIVWSELSLLRQQVPKPASKPTPEMLPPNGHLRATKRTFGPDQTDICGGTKWTSMSAKPREAQSTASNRGEVAAEDGNGWEEAEAALKQAGLATAPEIARAAQERGQTPADVLDAIDEYERHKGQFRGPGAITFRLRTGTWPTNAIIGTKMQQAANERRRLEEAMSNSIGSYVQNWRSIGVSDDEIRDRLHGALSSEDMTAKGLSLDLLNRMGWGEVSPSETSSATELVPQSESSLVSRM